MYFSGASTGAVVVLSGVDLDDPVGAVGGVGSTQFGTSFNLPTVTFERTDGSSLLLSMVSHNNPAPSTTINPPGGFTPVTRDTHNSGGAGSTIGRKTPTAGQTSQSAFQTGLPASSPGGSGRLIEIRAASA